MINLEKGQRISMDKGLSLVGVGLGWDPNEGTGFDFDLDAAAFMLGSNGQIPAQEYFVFYNNMKSPDGSVETTGDDLTGGNSDGGDDETLNVDLTKVSPQIQEIVFTATIHKAEERRQNFGQVRNSYIRIQLPEPDIAVERLSGTGVICRKPSFMVSAAIASLSDVDHRAVLADRCDKADMIRPADNTVDCRHRGYSVSHRGCPVHPVTRNAEVGKGDAGCFIRDLPCGPCAVCVASEVWVIYLDCLPGGIIRPFRGRVFLPALCLYRGGCCHKNAGCKNCAHHFPDS